MFVLSAVIAKAEGRAVNVAGVCRDNGVSRQHFYDRLRRFRGEGLAGFEPRSRRPLSSPNQTAVDVEDRIVELRKRLADEGLDHGRPRSSGILAATPRSWWWRRWRRFIGFWCDAVRSTPSLTNGRRDRSVGSRRRHRTSGGRSIRWTGRSPPAWPRCSTSSMITPGSWSPAAASLRPPASRRGQPLCRQDNDSGCRRECCPTMVSRSPARLRKFEVFFERQLRDAGV
jgi:hypothetical protein